MSNNSKEKTIFLDFDGVLFDTVKESYLLSRYAYYRISPFDKINEKEYSLFHSLRHLITNSWNYYFVMKIIDKYQDVDNYSDLYKKMIKEDRVVADEFDKIFQQKRKDLITNHFEFWNSLDDPYPFFYEIKKWQEVFNIIIVSTKNEEAILSHCKDYGLKIDEKNIIGKSKLKEYKTKSKFIEEYLTNNNISEAIFVEDNLSALKACEYIKPLIKLLANWGYVEDMSLGLSCQEIINIITKG